MNTQSEALRLADWLSGSSHGPLDVRNKAATELRRLHEEAASLRDQNTELDRKLAEMEQRREWVGLAEKDWLAIACKTTEEARVGLDVAAKLREKNA